MLRVKYPTHQRTYKAKQWRRATAALRRYQVPIQSILIEQWKQNTKSRSHDPGQLLRLLHRYDNGHQVIDVLTLNNNCQYNNL